MTITKNDSSLTTHFSKMKDPRIDRAKRHKLIDIIVIAICAIICGADGWEGMEIFGNAKKDWLSTYLELPNGIPGHDTFRRVFERLEPEVFQNCFLAWVQALFVGSQGDIIPIDGKTVRRSYDRGIGKDAIHLVQAWSCKNQLVLGQLKTDSKSNEITAIPQLLDLIDLNGGIVTIDAMGCQKKIAEKIVSKEADYIFGLKGNQSGLLDDVTPYFDDVIPTSRPTCDFLKKIEKGHGRIETRCVWSMPVDDWLKKTHPAWENLSSITMIEATRQLRGSTSTQRRYYISSLPPNASMHLKAIRAHWAIENSVHWVLDVTFKEDLSRVRSKNAAENLALLRKVALNLLRRDSSLKRGAPQKRLKAACDNAYLEKILAG